LIIRRKKLFSKTPDKIKPFPIKVYLTAVGILAVCGILVSIYLFVSHYRVYTDIGYSSFCAISKAINCDTVSQSPYSIFIGIPVSIWGILGYILLLVTLFLSFNPKSQKISNLPTLFMTAMVFSAMSIFLGAVSAFKIHSYCLMCVVTYAINFILLYMIWLIKQRFEKKTWGALAKENFVFWKQNRNKAFRFYSPIILIILLLIVFLPDYWNITATDSGRQDIKTGITEDGDPWIGAETPELTIIEYSDYMCFQCKKMHFFLRNLITRYPNKIRLVHRHYPMDQKYNPVLKEDLHPGSGVLSLIAVYAARENKFWAVNDYLYDYSVNKAIYLRQIAEGSGLHLDHLKTGIHAPEIIKKLKKDILSGMKANIIGTPSYIIDKKLYAGQIPPEILKSLE